MARPGPPRSERRADTEDYGAAVATVNASSPKKH